MSNSPMVPQPHSKVLTATLADYVGLVVHNPSYACLITAEVMVLLGYYLTYIAILSIIHDMGNGDAMLLSLLAILQSLPAFLLPLCGVVADMVDRRTVLLTVPIACAAVVLGYPWITQPHLLWMLYVLVFLEASIDAFYEPARKALLPHIVPQSQLHLAATIDSTVWSVVTTFATGLGGAIATTMGRNACFYIDACTLLTGGLVLWMMPPPSAQGGSHFDAKGAPVDQEQGALTAALLAEHDRTVGCGVAWMDAHTLEHHHPSTMTVAPMEAHTSVTHTQTAADTLPGAPLLLAPPLPEAPPAGPVAPPPPPPEVPPPTQPLLFPPAAQLPGRRGSGSSLRWHRAAGPVSPADAHLIEDEVEEELEGVGMWRLLKEGVGYLCARENRVVAAFVSVKACERLCSGATEIIQIRFASMDSMHVGGMGSEATLSVLLLVVGLGCLVGPLLCMAVVPGTMCYMTAGLAVCFLMFAASYVIVAITPTFTMLVVSVLIHSMASSVLWVYAELLLQLTVPNQYMGRIVAFEIAGATAASALSALAAGVWFDVAHWTMTQLLGCLTGVSCVLALGWMVLAGYVARASKQRPDQATQ